MLVPILGYSQGARILRGNWMKTIVQCLFDGRWLAGWESRQRHYEASGRWRPMTLLLCGMALLLGIQNPLLYGMAPGFDA